MLWEGIVFNDQLVKNEEKHCQDKQLFLDNNCAVPNFQQ